MLSTLLKHMHKLPALSALHNIHYIIFTVETIKYIYLHFEPIFYKYDCIVVEKMV